ncbi:hypothetical protein D3C76_1604490 [compost metagenome]
MIVLFRGQLFSEDTQAPGHPQMDNDPAIRQREQQVLRSALYAENRFIAQGVDLIRNRPAETSVADNSVKNGRTDQVGLNATTAGLYLR